jgi:site-specific DNA-methyltransferase (adenine-specific)
MAEINIYNCDCMEFMKALPDKAYELAIVDPPYGIDADIEQNKNAIAGRISNGGTWKKYKNTNWDSNIPTIEYFKQLFRVSKIQIIWGGNYFFLPPCCKWIVWNKVQRGYMTDGEMAWTSMKGQVSIFDMSRTDAYINKCDGKIHPTQKPVALYQWLLKNYAKQGDKILDTHGGSCSIAIACDIMGFDLDVCELDTDYYNAAVERFERHKRQGVLQFD